MKSKKNNIKREREEKSKYERIHLKRLPYKNKTFAITDYQSWVMQYCWRGTYFSSVFLFIFLYINIYMGPNVFVYVNEKEIPSAI